MGKWKSAEILLNKSLDGVTIKQLTMRADLSRGLSLLHTCQRLLINSFMSHCPYDTLDHVYCYFCSCETLLKSLMLPAYVCVYQCCHHLLLTHGCSPEQQQAVHYAERVEGVSCCDELPGK